MKLYIHVKSCIKLNRPYTYMPQAYILTDLFSVKLLHFRITLTLTVSLDKE